MKNYYLFQAEKLHRKDDTIEIVMKDNIKRSLPVEQVDTIFVFTEMMISTKVLELLSKHEIIVHFFNYYGFYNGSFYPKEHNVSGYVLIEQVRALDSEKKQYIAIEFINSSIANIKRNLVYYSNRGADVEKNLIYLNALQSKIKETTSVEELMGFEGAARKVYYEAWSEILNEYDLPRRIRRPPTDIVNVLISFLNTLLYTTCLGEIYKTHLNPTISFLHKPGRKKFSLCLDISEVFKPLLVDRLIFKLLNKRMINEKSFSTEGEILILKESGIKTILKAYDEEINRTIFHTKLKRKISYKSLIKLECYKIIKYILEDEPYKGFTLEW